MTGLPRGAVRRWIFEEYAEDPRSLAIYRIVFVLALLFFMLPRYRRLWLLDLPDSFYLPPLGLAAFFTAFPPAWFFLFLIVAMAVASVCLLFGWRTSWMSIGLAVMFIVGNSFDYAMAKIDHDILVVIVLLVMGSHWGARYSRDGARHSEASPRPVSGWPLALLALLVGMAMFSAGAPKMTSGWLSAATQAVRAHMTYNFYIDERHTLLAKFLLSIHSATLWELMDWGTVLLEVSLLPAAFSRRAMRWTLAVATLFHAVIHFSMLIFFFSNLIAYAAFVDWGRALHRPSVRRGLDAFGALATRVSPWTLIGAGLGVGGIYAAVGNPMNEVLRLAGQGRWLFASLISLIASGIALLYLARAALRFAASPATRPLILFDGVCGLCNRWVDLVLRWDTRHVFRFAPLQSRLARAVAGSSLDSAKLDSVILVRGDRVDRYSTAILEVFRLLGGWWMLLYALILVPKIVRDLVYDVVASRRYRWFGQMAICRLPTAEERARFVDIDAEQPPGV